MTTNKKQTICLAVIMKQEAHVLPELLENVYKYIDYAVFNDTGSLDGSQGIVKAFFAEKNIPCDVYDHEFRSCPLSCHGKEYKRYNWFHFGWNRSWCMQQCVGKGDYIWVIDCDDLVVGNLVFPELTHDAISLTYGQGFTYQRLQLFKNDPKLNFKYSSGLHEFPSCDKKNYTTGYIKGDYFINSRRLGDRSKNNADKYLKDALIFEELLLEEPDNDRYTFYGAQSYDDHGDKHNALRLYKKRIQLANWWEEVYYSYYKVAKIMETLQYPWPEVEKAYMDAFNYCKIRVEPLYHISNHYRMAGDFQTAYKFAKKGSVIPFPEKCVLFIHKDMYDYKIMDELSVNAFYIGKYHESLSIAQKLLDGKLAPDSEIPRITQNIVFSKQKLAEKEKKVCCVYVGNEILSRDTALVKLLTYMSKYYKVILVGDKLDPYTVDNVIIANTSTFKSLDTKELQVDYLVIYNSINYYHDTIKLTPVTTILLQNDHIIKLLLNNGMHLGVYNNEYLNNIFTKLNIQRIVCANKKIKNKLVSEYRLSSELVGDFELVDETDTYKLFDDITNKYNFKLPMMNDTNNYTYQDPPFIKLLKDNKAVYSFSKPLLIKYYEDIVKQLPAMPEHLYKLSAMNMEFNDYGAAQTNLDAALDVIKNNKAYDSYKDVILIAKSKILHKLEKYNEAYTIADEVLRRDLLPESLRVASEDIRDVNVDYLKDTYLFYNQNRIKKLADAIKTKKTKRIMLSMTTCKRFDLFEKTVNSFLNCCLDLDQIDHWLCVDDNSSQEDRNKMKKQYPFIEYIWKNEDQKGHYISMNMIRNYALDNNTEYLLHMEDDWHFIQKRNYITESFKIFSENQKIGQVLFNINYAEVELSKRKCKGGLLKKAKDGSRYYIHEHYDTNSKAYNEFIERHKGFGTCGYWPHFSFRPSIVKTSVLKEVGSYFNTAHFEMQYAIEYVSRGYVSAFFDAVCCLHTGKKTWENNGINSYHLNKTGQFTLTNDELYVNVISNNNIEEWKSFKESAVDKLPYFIRVIPKPNTTLDDYERKAFYKNNFNYLRAIMKPIVTSLNLLRQNKSKNMMVLKHNIQLIDNFNDVFSALLNIIKNSDYDIILLDTYESNKVDKIQLLQKTQTINLETCCGYLISTSGIQKILDHIEMNRIQNIDYLENITGLNVFVLNQPLYVIKPTQSIIEDSTFTKLDGYTFYSQLDSFGGDICHVGSKSIEEYKTICEKENGTCFNTLGFIKHTLDTEENFIYLPGSTKACQGLYVKN